MADHITIYVSQVHGIKDLHQEVATQSAPRWINPSDVFAIGSPTTIGSPLYKLKRNEEG